MKNKQAFGRQVNLSRMLMISTSSFRIFPNLMSRTNATWITDLILHEKTSIKEMKKETFLTFEGILISNVFVKERHLQNSTSVSIFHLCLCPSKSLSFTNTLKTQILPLSLSSISCVRSSIS
jgi:hypothetical protein